MWDTISSYSSFPLDEVTAALQEMARKFQIKEGELNGSPLFFKECDDLKLTSSLVFDIANFAVSATSALVSTDTADVAIEVEHRFETKAEEYVKATVPPSVRVQPRNEIIEVPGVKFGAVLRDGPYIWLVSYVNGSTLTIFRQRLSDTIINFQHAKESTQQDRIRGTIPIINNEAAGYQPSKLALHLEDLKQTSENKVVEWTHKERFREVLLASVDRVPPRH